MSANYRFTIIGNWPSQSLSAVFVLAFVTSVCAQMSTLHGNGKIPFTSDRETGIRLDRLSPKHQKIWQSIKQIILAENADGTALHPKLWNLFEQLQTSNHTIYVEFAETDEGCHCVAGRFYIEQLDPAGFRNIGVIKLYLRTIAHASTDRPATSKDEFIPMTGLKKMERYAEVLGHEMAHAVDILFNRERAQLVDGILKKTNQVLRERVRIRKIKPEWEVILRQSDTFLIELEKPALMAEEEVWRELRKKGRASTNQNQEQ